MDYPIENLGLSVRPYNSLRRAGIKTYGDLAKMTEEKLIMTRNFGRKSLDEVVQKFLEATGIDISKNIDPDK